MKNTSCFESEGTFFWDTWYSLQRSINIITGYMRSGHLNLKSYIKWIKMKGIQYKSISVFWYFSTCFTKDKQKKDLLDLASLALLHYSQTLASFYPLVCLFLQHLKCLKHYVFVGHKSCTIEMLTLSPMHRCCTNMAHFNGMEALASDPFWHWSKEPSSQSP